LRYNIILSALIITLDNIMKDSKIEDAAPPKVEIKDKLIKAGKKVAQVLTSPTVVTVGKLAVGSVGIAVAATTGVAIPLAIAGAATALAIGTYAIAKKVADIKKYKQVTDEHKCLKKSHTTQTQRDKALQKLQLHGINPSDLAIQTSAQNRENHPELGKTDVRKISTVPVELRAAARVSVDSVIKGSAGVIIGAVTLNPVQIATSVISTSAGAVISGVITKKNIAARDNIKKEINEMAQKVPVYKDIRELRNITLERLAETRALTQLNKRLDPNNSDSLAGKTKPEIINEFRVMKVQAIEDLRKEEPELFSEKQTKEMTKSDKAISFIKRVGDAINPNTEVPSIAEYNEKERIHVSASDTQVTINPIKERVLQKAENKIITNPLYKRENSQTVTTVNPLYGSKEVQIQNKSQKMIEALVMKQSDGAFSVPSSAIQKGQQASLAR